MSEATVTLAIPPGLYERAQSLVEIGMFTSLQDLAEYGLRRALFESASVQEVKIAAVQDLRDPALRLLSPLYVTVEGNDPVLVNHSDLDIFGCGDTEGEAIDDFCRCVVETFWELKAQAGNLGPHLERIWGYLSKIVAEE